MKLEKLKTIQLQDMLDYCKGKKDIFLYGTGDVAKALIYDIRKYTNIEIKAIVVSDGMKDLDELSGIPVFEVSRVNIGNKDGVIVATRNDNWREIDENIRKRGYGNSIFFQQVNNSISCMQRVADSSFFINGTSNSGEYFEELKDLQVIGKKYGTDKSRAGFLSKYDFVLKKYRNEDIVFVELGVFMVSI